jgi:hypothetical protein
MQLATIIILLLCLVAIVLAVVLGPRMIVDRQQGEWVTTTTGPCINNERNCQLPGKTFHVQRCQINLASGHGCRDEEGKYQYGIRIVEKDCQAVCRSLEFVDVTPADQPCVVRRNGVVLGPDDCFQQGLDRATLTKTLRCQPADPTGINACTLTGPDGKLKIYNEGDEVTEEVACDNFTQNVCGQWSYVPGATPGVVSSPLIGDAKNCVFDSTYQLSPLCQSTGLLREGFIQRPMTCQTLLYDSKTGDFGTSLITPSPTRSLASLCVDEGLPCVSSLSPSLHSVATKLTSLPPPDATSSSLPSCQASPLSLSAAPSSLPPLACPGVNGYANYTCLAACRLWDETSFVYVPYLAVTSGSFKIPIVVNSSLTTTTVSSLQEVFDQGLFLIIGDGLIIAQQQQSQSGWLSGASASWLPVAKGYGLDGYLSSSASTYSIVVGSSVSVNIPLTTPTGVIVNNQFQATGTLTIQQQSSLAATLGGAPLTLGGLSLSQMTCLVFPFSQEGTIDLSARGV